VLTIIVAGSCWLAFAPLSLCILPYKSTLHLGPEEATLEVMYVLRRLFECYTKTLPWPHSFDAFSVLIFLAGSNICGHNVSKNPYGELGNVDKTKFCCCVCVSSGFGELSPGCGCDEEQVDKIVADLKARVRVRGDTGQIQRSEQTLEKLKVLDAKLVRLLSRLYEVFCKPPCLILAHLFLGSLMRQTNRMLF
jgi:hypothetical protein